MLRGDFEAAWRETDRTEDARRRTGEPQAALPPHLRRVWNGCSIDDKRVLVRCYHGLGDTIHFIRYIPLLKRRAREIYLDCQPPLVPLMLSLQGISETVFLTEGSAPEYDVEVELMELPYILRSTLSTIPRIVPYLSVPPKVREAARTRCSAPGFRIGLAWSSGDWNPDRSISLVQLDRLARIPGVRLFSLQRGEASHEISRCPHIDIIDTERDIQSPPETAATTLHMDLVISVDTMVAHLAGALGAPVWLLLPHCADWRWMVDRRDSPWYPTMHLFRQDGPGEWEPVVQEVAQALSGLVLLGRPGQVRPLPR